MIASRPARSSNGATSTSAPVARAARTAVAMSLTRYPLRSTPNGYGVGVVKPKTEMVPKGVNINCEIVLLGVGVTVMTDCLEVVPPKGAKVLATGRWKYCGATE